MKTKIISTLAVAAALTVPVFAHAQSDNGPVTRAQVKAQLVELENAGYRPDSDRNAYPDNIQAAQRRVNAAHHFDVNGSSGASTSGSTASGTRRSAKSDSYGTPNWHWDGSYTGNTNSDTRP